MSEVKKTAQSAATYAIGVIVSRLAGIIMLPIYTRYLTPADYGVIELLIMTIDIIGILVSAGISESIFRFYFKENQPLQRKRVLFTAHALLLCFYLVTGCTCLLFAEEFAHIILEGRALDIKAFQLIFIIFMLDPLQTVPLIFIRAQQQAKLFVTINISRLLFQLSLNIYFVVIAKMGIEGILFSTLITFCSFGILLSAYLLYHTRLAFHIPFVRQLFIYGSPLVIANICNFILTFSDRYFLKMYTGLSSVGIYSLGYKLGFILSALTVTPIFSTWDPKRFEISDDEDFQEINGQVFFYSSLLIIFAALCITIGSRDLFRIMSAPSFVEAYKLVPYIILAYIFQAWANFANFGIYHTGKTQLLAISGIINAGIMLLLSILLIPRWGAQGAALATMLTFLCQFLLIRHFANRLFPIFFPWQRALYVLAVAVVLCILSFTFQQEKLLLSICQDILFALLFPLCIYFSPLLDDNERNWLKKIIQHPTAMIKSLRR